MSARKFRQSTGSSEIYRWIRLYDCSCRFLRFLEFCLSFVFFWAWIFIEMSKRKAWLRIVTCDPRTFQVTRHTLYLTLLLKLNPGVVFFQNSLDDTEDESGESGDPAGPARRRASQSAGSHHDSPSFHRRGGGGPTVPGKTTNSLSISKFFSPCNSS